MAAMQSVRPGVSLGSLLGSQDPQLSELTISGIELDSRRISSGDLFLAVCGERYDGRNFIEQAVANGAAAVLAEAPAEGFVDEVSVPLIEVAELQREIGIIAGNFFARPSASMHMVGVTGTNGKTTTTQIIAQLGRLLGGRYGVIGTLGSDLNGTATATGNTTPDAVALQRQLAQWRDQGAQAVAMEVSSHALVQSRVQGINFDTAVFTNLSQDHLDYHGSMASYGQAKTQLFASEGLDNAVINLDDDYAAVLSSSIPPAVKVLTYSARGNPAADVLVDDVRFHGAGVRAMLRTPWGSGECNSPLPGDFNLANLAAAIAALLLRGENFERLLEKVPKVRSVSGRMQLIDNDAGLQVVIDYAHTPDALEQALRALRPHVSGEIVTVFGCGGNRDRSKRSVMGRLACELSDRVIVTSDNPRDENPAAIMRDIESGCLGRYQMIVERAEAIAEALTTARAGDCVLIAGKGHEDYQIIEGEHRHFSDEEQARLALAGRSGQ